MDHADIQLVRQKYRLSDLVRSLTKLRPCSGGFVGLCIFHKEKTASFHVSDTRGTYKCYGCGAWGDAIDFVMQTRGLSFKDALSELQGSSHTVSYIGQCQTRDSIKADASEDDKRRIAHAHGLWLKREPVPGTLAEDYLRQIRAVSMPIPDILGFVDSAYCSPLGEETAALIAPLQNSAGHVTAVQQIFLCRETMDAWRDDNNRRIKRTLGAMQDGCVRLGLPDTTLGLAGSVEDALAASELFSLPVWATCGEQRFERVWIPPEIEELIIFADADKAGRDAAEAAKRRFGGRMAVMIHAPDGLKDWNADLQRRVGT
jgi:DNA primase